MSSGIESGNPIAVAIVLLIIFIQRRLLDFLSLQILHLEYSCAWIQWSVFFMLCVFIGS